MRVKSLEGLRGISAVIVVAHHQLLTLPWFSNRLFQKVNTYGNRGSFNFSVPNLIEFSPAHIFYAGSEAVFVFFILSGYVLIFAVKKQELSKYLRARLIRLYFPIFGSVIIASFFLDLVNRVKQVGQSEWLQFHIIENSLSDMIKNLFVIAGTTNLNSSLWSMKYEILFSILIIAFSRFNLSSNTVRFTLAQFFCFLTIFFGTTHHIFLLTYLAIFYSGVTLHLCPKKSKLVLLRLNLGILILLSPWYFYGFGYHLNQFFDTSLKVLGALLIVDACRVENSNISKFLDMNPINLLGRYSYSIYLVHAPILVTVWFALGNPSTHLIWILHCCISLFCIFLGSIVIYTFFEKPSLKFITRYK